MKRLLLAAFLLALICPAFAQYDPVADPAAQVVAGNARFTVLTDRMIRMEWSPEAKFEDHATLAIVNRKLPVPRYTIKRSGDGVTISTGSLTLVYKGGKFAADNLQARFKLNGKSVVWHPGLPADGNLMGTARTLDGCSGPDHINYSDPMELGILSRDGWAVVDESTRHLFVDDDSDWGQWVEARGEGEVQDLYLLAYGHDYKAALSDFTKVAGRIPMPPKYAFGYWWSRYWAYTDDEFLALGREFRDRKIPIDIMVIDMDWHETWQGAARRGVKDDHGEGLGWTGYTWNRNLIGDPAGFLREVHDMHLKTSLNLHPAAGIIPQEEVYPAFVADYLSRTDDYDGPEGYVYKGGEPIYGGPAKPGYHASVQYRMDQRAWADAYFNSIIHPMERQGVDFWWLDWQQYKESRYVPGLSNTFWINHIFFNDKVRLNRDKAPEDAIRPMIYHRWGGLGSHRYQLGFSGDTHIKWEVLGYLPEFTSTASNVLYGYWGHDLGGHMQREAKPTEPELFTRWLQYGVFSPIFKTHCTSSDIIERRIWMFPDHYPYMKEALELRYALTPYIYDMAREAYETGVSLCRPLYYEYPEEAKAYEWKQEYFFGDNILAATICEPIQDDGLAPRSVWLPAGCDWYDMAHHKMLRGGTIQYLRYGIDQNAWFVKAGAILPLAEEGIQNLQTPSNALRIYIAPGKGTTRYMHYEDDGISQAYPEQFATTLIEKTAAASTLKVKVGPRQGSYKGMPATRRLSLVLGGLDRCPAQVLLDGKPLECSYDPETREAVAVLPEHDVSQQILIAVRY